MSERPVIGTWISTGTWIGTWNPICNVPGIRKWTVILIGTGFLFWIWKRNRDHAKTGLRYRVECFGQGKAHEDIMNKLGSPGEDPEIPCVLFVYKVSREIEDLRNALQWIQRNRMIKKEDLCAVVLLEKASNEHDKPVEVDHGDVFDEKTAVVRYLWEETRPWPWFLLRLVFPGKKRSRHEKVMKKVIQSIREWQRE